MQPSAGGARVMKRSRVGLANENQGALRLPTWTSGALALVSKKIDTPRGSGIAAGVVGCSPKRKRLHAAEDCHWPRAGKHVCATVNAQPYWTCQRHASIEYLFQRQQKR